MKKGYSEDLRKRAVDAVLVDKKTIKEVSNLYKVHYESVRSWIDIYKKHGVYKLEPKKEYKPRKIDLDALKKHVQDYPDLYLAKRAEYFGVSTSTIWKNLQKLDPKPKKATRLIRKNNQPASD